MATKKQAETAKPKVDNSYLFLDKDRKQFRDIADLFEKSNVDWTVARTEQLKKYSKPDLNIILTVHAGGMTQSVLAKSTVAKMVQLIVDLELKKLGAQTLKNDGKVKYPHPTGKSGRSKMDEGEKREWFQSVKELIEKNYTSDDNPLKERIAGGKVAGFSFKMNKVAVSAMPRSGQKVFLSTRVKSGEQHEGEVALVKKQWDEFFAEAKSKQDAAHPKKAEKSAPKKSGAKPKAKPASKKK